MVTILSCIAFQHDISLVLLAAVLCTFGSWVTARLYRHAKTISHHHAISWHLLTALTAGVTIWCTHFVAMLGFRPDAPVSFDLALTFVSLLIAVAGSAAGMLFSTMVKMRFAPAIGGAILGLGVSGMHYTGMIAYRVQGIVYWDKGYLVASILLASAFGAMALCLGGRSKRWGEYVMTGALTFAIVSLHFTGMAAFTVAPLAISGDFVNPEAFKMLALAITGTAMVIVMGALYSYVVENRTRLESIAELTAARNAAENASRAKSEFLSVLSHELRTPLTIVLGYSGILAKLKEVHGGRSPETGELIDLQDSRLGDKAELYGQQITVAANQLLGLINEILDYTGMELGDTQLERSSFPVGALLDEVRDQFQVPALKKSVTITVEHDAIVAHADRARCLQILVHLVGNALKFAKSSDILLRARFTGDGFAIEVEDNGCGIPDAAQERIFDAFQQLEPSGNRSEGGAGLGLAICRKLAAAHGGDISVRSAAGAGTTFTVALPADAIDRAATSAAEADAAKTRAAAGLRLAG